jgi:hypothetical protein
MAELSGAGGFRAEAGIRRGENSWQTLYLGLGFTLTVGGTLIQFILPWAWNLVVYLAFIFLAYGLFIWNDWFQKWFLRLVRWTEERLR